MQTGKDKIKNICDILKNEALVPAHQEAENIILKAQKKAESIVKDAEKEAEDILSKAKDKISQEKNVFDSALLQASRQSLQALRQEIEVDLFDVGLESLVVRGSSDPGLLSKLIDSLVKAIDKEGISVDFSVIIPEAVSKDEVNKLLAEDVVKRLKDNGVILGKFEGGVRVLLHDKKLTLDISDVALRDLLGSYLRKDFRNILFKS